MRIFNLVLLCLVLSAAQSYATCLKAHRSQAVRRAFLHSTGYPYGRPGYIIDHIVPLCAGGADSLSNLQWQERAVAQRKDQQERAICHALWK